MGRSGLTRTMDIVSFEVYAWLLIIKVPCISRIKSERGENVSNRHGIYTPGMPIAKTKCEVNVSIVLRP